MKIGIVADGHLGYFRGTKTFRGVNVRERDVIDSYRTAVRNLVNEGAEAILDLGDIANTPSPRKRAILALTRIITEAGVPFHSVNGNHTLTRAKSDIHLYEFLEAQCPNFHGYTEAAEALGGWLVPYGSREEVLEAVTAAPSGISFVAGHWACSDVPFPGDHLAVADLPRLPILLGHYHKRTPAGQESWRGTGPVYVGSTDRFAWGEWDNPTGSAIYEDGELLYIDHQSRPWVDLETPFSSYLDDIRAANFEDALVRVTIDATEEEYQSMDLVATRKALNGSLEYQIRRRGRANSVESDRQNTPNAPLEERWRDHLKTAKMPKGVSKKEVEEIGSTSLSTSHTE